MYYQLILLTKKERHLLHSSIEKIKTAGDAGVTILLMVSNIFFGSKASDMHRKRGGQF